MKVIAIIALAIGLTTSPAIAQSPSNALGNCMAQQTTGADREHFAKWIFSVIAEHPVTEPLSNISEGERERIDSKMAILVTRLVAEDCRQEAKTTLDSGGDQEFLNAFRAMGEIAMQEIFRNKRVAQSSENYIKYLDYEDFGDLFN